jgi:predicted dehydrogenase
MSTINGKGISIGIVGAGAFAQRFIPLFKAHPLVGNIILCDLDAKKLEESVKRYEIKDTCSSLDELYLRNVDAVAIFTQNWLHGPQSIQSLKAGKHVYSAVPSAITMEEITSLVKTVQETGRIYMVGETSYYYPCALYCRERFRKGDFGKIVYGEGEYYHDFDHGLYDVMKWRGGVQWKRFAGSPPMYYPTHSVSLVVSVTGAHATHVSCMGFVDKHKDGLFRKGVNIWDNEFSNETALMRMSDGSMCRINEFRRVGHPGTVRMSLYGTEGSYEEKWLSNSSWLSKDRSRPGINLTDLLSCSGIPAEQINEQMAGVTSTDGTHLGVSKIHPVERLPREFIGLPNGHNGSHQFLVDDFVKACVSGRQPPNNVWQAARYLIPGLVAHESAKQGGILLEVPDLGDSLDRN